MEAKTFGDILIDLKAEALVDTLSDTLLNAEAETLKVKIGNVEDETVANTLKEEDSSLFYITLGNVHGEAPCHNLVVTLADAEAEKLGDILCTRLRTCTLALSEKRGETLRHLVTN